MDDWRKYIPMWLWNWVSKISMDTPVYLVGGIVRDGLLGRMNTDLDLVIEGDAIAFAHAMQQQHGGSVLTHDRFGTAKWISEHGEIDFVTARSETYPAPAALPTVTAGSMTDDLYRRDFSINALALRLDGVHLGEIVDHYRGLADLEMGHIRVLHENSFIDDPTRIFRAVRYEQRLGFAIEPQTLTWLLRDKHGVGLLSGDRLRHEIEYVLKEPRRTAMLVRLTDLDVWSAIVVGLHWKADWAEAFHAYAVATPTWGTQIDWEAYWLLWLMRLDIAVREEVFERLNVGQRVRKSARNTTAILQHLLTLPPTATPSQITFALDPFQQDTTALLIAHLLTQNKTHASWLLQYQTIWRTIRAPITGNELRRMGLQPGPHFREILDLLRGIVLDGIEN